MCINVIQSFETDLEIIIAMEYAHGGDLYTQLSKHGPIPNEREAFRLFSHMVSLAI